MVIQGQNYSLIPLPSRRQRLSSPNHDTRIQLLTMPCAIHRSGSLVRWHDRLCHIKLSRHLCYPIHLNCTRESYSSMLHQLGALRVTARAHTVFPDSMVVPHHVQIFDRGSRHQLNLAHAQPTLVQQTPQPSCMEPLGILQRLARRPLALRSPRCLEFANRRSHERLALNIELRAVRLKPALDAHPVVPCQSRASVGKRHRHINRHSIFLHPQRPDDALAAAPARAAMCAQCRGSTHPPAAGAVAVWTSTPSSTYEPSMSSAPARSIRRTSRDHALVDPSALATHKACVAGLSERQLAHGLNTVVLLQRSIFTSLVVVRELPVLPNCCRLSRRHHKAPALGRGVAPKAP